MQQSNASNDISRLSTNLSFHPFALLFIKGISFLFTQILNTTDSN